jgi:Zn-finger nucleic acid-binding protein
MNCPVCKSVILAPAEVDTALASRQCGKCDGHWVASAAYFAWLEQRGTDLPEKPAGSDVDLTISEVARAKLCPECGRFLTRAKVGHGVNFHLDRCGACGGVWFDANEWEVLRRRNLHDDVHFVFSSAWQADVARRDREAAYDRLMGEKLGDADWAEVKRIRAWLDGHPKRSQLYAALTWEVGAELPAGHKAGAGDGPH